MRKIWNFCAVSLALATGCALEVAPPAAPSDAPPDAAEAEPVYLGLVGAARRPRAALIRDVAAASGLFNGVLLAGIAQVESGLSHCWSEATWACQGPYAASCNGPVIAGSADGPCSAQQGGLGMFQFDGGNYAQTLARDGEAILLLEGNIARAVEFVATMVMRHVPGVDTRARALAHLNDIPVAANEPGLQAWAELLACRYNGRCGSQAQAAKYRDATLALRDELGADFWSDLPAPPATITCFTPNE